MTRVFACIILAVNTMAEGTAGDEQGAALLRTLIHNKDNVHTYSYGYKGKQTLLMNMRESLVDTQAEPSYQEYDYTLSEAYDNGKMAFEVQRPRVVSGKGIIPGETDNVRQVFDGEVVIQNERPNHYLLSRTPARYAGLMTPMKFRDMVLSSVGSELDKGAALLSMESDGPTVLLHIGISSDAAQPTKQSVSIKVNKEQGNRIEEISCGGSSAVFSDFRDLGGGVVIPIRGEVTIVSGGKVFQKDEMTIDDLHVNEDIDPSRFRMEIPPGATVFHEDLGIQTDAMNSLGADAVKSIEENLLSVGEEQAKKDASSEGDDAKAADAQKNQASKDGLAGDSGKPKTPIGRAVIGISIGIFLMVTVVLIRAARKRYGKNGLST